MTVRRARPGLVRRRVFTAAALGVAIAGSVASTTARASENQFAKGPYLQNVTTTSAEIRVEMDPPAPVQIELGGDAGPPSLLHKDAAAFHVFHVEGLEPQTHYRFSAMSGGTTKVGTFDTAPNGDTTDPITFLVYGDNRTDESAHVSIVRAMTSHPSSFLIHTGDFVENGGVPGLWQRFFDIEAPLLATRPIYATIGNHELVDKDARLYLRYFGPSDPNGAAGTASGHPLLHSTFRWGFLRFFMLGGMTDLAEEKQWLDAELDKSDKETDVTFRIAVTHHGPWSSGPHGRNARIHDSGIVESLRKHHIDIIISGHDHIYERGEMDGMAYLVSGGGGAPSYEQREKLSCTRCFDPGRHFVEVKANPKVMQFTALRPDGSTIERCGLVHGRGWDCDASITSATTGGEGGTATTSGSTKDTKSSSSCGSCAIGSATATRGANGGAGIAAVGLALAGFLRRRRKNAAPRCRVLRGR